MDDRKSICFANQKCDVASLVDCQEIRRRDTPAVCAARPKSSLDALSSFASLKQEKHILQAVADKAILRLARALARQAAREDHARECADKVRHNETSRDLRPLLDRSSG